MLYTYGLDSECIFNATKLWMGYNRRNKQTEHGSYMLPLIEDILHVQFRWRVFICL